MSESTEGKLQSLFAMLAAVGHLRSYQFPVVQMAMGNTMGAGCAEPEQALVDGSRPDAPSAPNPFSREAEELYMQFRRNEP